MAEEIKMPVEATHIMMFARSLLDENPIYSDSDFAANSEVRNIIAPPTFGRAASACTCVTRTRALDQNPST